MILLERVDMPLESFGIEITDAQFASALYLRRPRSLFCGKAVEYSLEMTMGDQRCDLGLNCGIIKHSSSAGLPAGAAPSQRIDDDLSFRGISRRDDQPDSAGQTNRDEFGRHDQFPPAFEKIDELAQVKLRRLLCAHSFVSAIRSGRHA